MQQAVAQMLWSHSVTLLDKLKEPSARSWYAAQSLDAELKGPEDQSTIGLLLCREKNRFVAVYALRGMTNPMCVARYQLRASARAALRAVIQ